jgi:signal transduction histidine kinase
MKSKQIISTFIFSFIVEAHGGKIWAENKPDGKGSTFTFSLPLSQNNKSYTNGNIIKSSISRVP